LRVLATNIEDQPHNITRFAVISERSEHRTGNDKTTILLKISNEIGALARVLAPFEKSGLNLTMIESFPAPDTGPKEEPAYMFFVDVEGHCDEEPVKRALEAVSKKCERLVIIGSYPRSDAFDQ